MMFDVMTMEEARKWLRSLVGTPKNNKTGLTIDSLAKYTGIPRNSLKWLVYRDTAILAIERLRLLSKVRSDYENGLIDFVGKGSSKRMVRPEKPRARVRYQVTLGGGAPALKAVDRPRPALGLPSLKSIFGKT